MGSQVELTEMTTVTCDPCQLAIDNSENRVQGKLECNTERITFTPNNSNDHTIILYSKLQMFATGNNDEFLLIIAEDIEASDNEDDDGDVNTVEYRVYCNNVSDLYKAMQDNQELHPPPVAETNDDMDGFDFPVGGFPVENGGGDTGPNGDAKMEMDEGENGQFDQLDDDN